MPSFSYDSDETSFWFEISGLTVGQTYGYRVTLNDSVVFRGNNIKVTSSTVKESFTDLEKGTYILVILIDGQVYTGHSFTIDGTTPTPPEPPREDWEWWHTVEKDQPILLSAAEWNAYAENVEAACAQKSSSSKVQRATKDSKITAAQINSAINALNSIGASGVPSIVSTGGTIYASTFQKLRDAVNSV